MGFVNLGALPGCAVSCSDSCSLFFGWGVGYIFRDWCLEDFFLFCGSDDCRAGASFACPCWNLKREAASKAKIISAGNNLCIYAFSLGYMRLSLNTRCNMGGQWSAKYDI